MYFDNYKIYKNDVIFNLCSCIVYYIIMFIFMLLLWCLELCILLVSLNIGIINICICLDVKNDSFILF